MSDQLHVRTQSRFILLPSGKMAHTSELHKASLLDVQINRCEQLELAIYKIGSFKPGKNSHLSI
jgi:hypothetical protein